MPSEYARTMGTAKEGAPYWSMHRVVGPNGALPARADLTGTSTAEIAYSVYPENSTAPATAETTGTFNKTAVWFDALQTDGYWDDEDGQGYNFRGEIPAAAFPNGAGRYRVEYQAVSTAFTLLTWEEMIDVVERFTA